MIVQKPADVDPVMKSVLKNYIMRKRQQLKQELEQDAIEKRLKRELEAKRKQDAMTLDQLKEQLSQLEKTLENLKNEKHHLFLQLKQNMRVSTEDDKQRKQKDQPNQNQQETNQHHQQLQQPNSQQHQPQQPQQQNQQKPITPQLNQQQQIQNPHLLTQQPLHQQQQQQPQQQQHHHQQQSNHQQPSPQPVLQTTPQSNQPLMAQQTNQQQRQQPNLQPPMSLPSQPPPPPPPQQQQQQQHLHHPQPQMQQTNSIPLHCGPIGNPQLPSNFVNQNLIRSPPPSNMSSLFNSAAFSHLLNTQNFSPRHSAYLQQIAPTSRPSLPFGHHSMSPYPQLGHHPGAPTSNSSTNPTGMSISTGGPTNSNINHNPNTSSYNTLLQSMKRPISATNLASDTVSPSKKLHTQPPPPSSQSYQVPSNLSNPYLGYTGLPPGLGGSIGGPSLQASMFSQNLIRTPPPPPNMNSLINSAAFSHLLNAQNFPRHPSYIPQMGQPGRNPLQFSHHTMNPYAQLGHHPGVSTSLAHATQNNPLMRGYPPPPPLQIPNSPQLNPGGHKLPNPPITTSGPLDFNPNLSTSAAQQLQQQALNNSAVAAAAALGLQFGPAYFNRLS